MYPYSYPPAVTRRGLVTLVDSSYCVIQGVLGYDPENHCDPAYSVFAYDDPTYLNTFKTVSYYSYEEELATGYEVNVAYKLRYIPSVREWAALDAIVSALAACNSVDLEAEYQPDGRSSMMKWMYGWGTRESLGGTPAYGTLETLLIHMLSDLWDDEFAARVRYVQTDSGENLQYAFKCALSDEINKV